MEIHHARILYAEDDADTRELVTLILESQTCQVIAVESAAEALRLARAEHFDLYLIDNWMPVISRVRLCEQLREFDRHTPVLFYSGAAYGTDRARALASGAQGYLIKPVDSDALIAEVLRLISDSRQSASTIGTAENPDPASRPKSLRTFASLREVVFGAHVKSVSAKGQNTQRKKAKAKNVSSL